MLHSDRILIIGSSGAGKSTLAVLLGERLGLQVVHLDAHYWRAGWVETPREEWERTVADLMAGERWIIDGNYGNTLPQRLAAAQTVVFLDFPVWLCLLRVIRRWLLHRGKTRPDMAPGCPEGMDWEFLKWVLFDFPRHSRPRILDLLATCGPEMQIITLRSPRTVKRFLDHIPRRPVPAPDGADYRVTPAQVEDLPAIMALIAAVIADMRAQGIEQWDENYPDRAIFANDIIDGSLFLARCKGELIGVVALNEWQAEAYANLSWQYGEGPVLVMHRLAVHPRWQRCGVARTLAHFAESYARGQGYPVMRLDTFGANFRAMSLYERCGYQRVAGELRFRNKGLFCGYEKPLAPPE